MKVNLANLLRQAAACIDPEKDTGAYAYMLAEEVAVHIDEVRGGKHTIQEFAEHYCLAAQATTTPEPTDPHLDRMAARMDAKWVEREATPEPTDPAGVSEMADRLEIGVNEVRAARDSREDDSAELKRLGRFVTTWADTILAALRTPSPAGVSEMAERLRGIVATVNDSRASLNTGDAGAWLMHNSERILAALSRTPSPVLEVAKEALENFCLAAEYWAGCDEGCDADTASSEIMRGGGAWPAEAYDKARAALQTINERESGQ